MSAAAEQLRLAPGPTLPIEARLPLDPRELVDLEPLERGRLYNQTSPPLDSWQRACIEAARRMCVAGTYPEVAR